MKLSELYAQVRDLPDDALAFTLYLAAPDGNPADQADVELCPVGRMEIDAAAAELRLYPAADGEQDTLEPVCDLGTFLGRLPVDVSGPNDLRLRVELPLVRDGSDPDPAGMTDVRELRIGNDTREAWLLTHPGSDFATGSRPR